MKFVRTVRSYEALTVTEGDKTHTVSATPLKVSNEAADAIEKVAASVGVAVESTDEASPFPPSTVKAAVGSSTVPNLADGVGAISGHGAPVPTFTAADAEKADADADGDPDEAPTGASDQATGTPVPGSTTTTSSTTSTTTKGK